MPDEHVKALLENVDELVQMLHEVWACATDTGGQTPEEAQAIFDRAELLLAEHGVQV